MSFVVTQEIQDFVKDLVQFGVKGMKWGVRKDDSSGSSSSQSSDAKAASAAQAKISRGGGTSSLNNSELQALVNRMNLEQQYSNLSSKSQTKSLGLRILQGSAKGTGKFAGQIAREQAKNAANMVLKQQVKKALKSKGLID